MLTRHDVATFDRRYRRFRAELCRSTRIDGIAFALWINARTHLLVPKWMEISDEHATVIDFEAWERWQYARAMRRVS